MAVLVLKSCVFIYFCLFLFCLPPTPKPWLSKDESKDYDKGKRTHTRANMSYVCTTIRCNTDRYYLNQKYKIVVSVCHYSSPNKTWLSTEKINSGQNCIDVATVLQETMTSFGMFCGLGLGSLYFQPWGRVLQCLNK